MTIEERAAALWGCTQDPSHGIWILQDGRILNGCQGGYVRDVDHAEIGQFFRTGKRHDPGSSWPYIKKFMFRGSIRFSFEGVAYFGLAKPPTEKQWAAMKRCMKAAMAKGMPCIIGRIGRRPGSGKEYGPEQYVRYLARYVPRLAPDPESEVFEIYAGQI